MATSSKKEKAPIKKGAKKTGKKTPARKVVRPVVKAGGGAAVVPPPGLAAFLDSLARRVDGSPTSSEKLLAVRRDEVKCDEKPEMVIPDEYNHEAGDLLEAIGLGVRGSKLTNGLPPNCYVCKYTETVDTKSKAIEALDNALLTDATLRRLVCLFALKEISDMHARGHEK